MKRIACIILLLLQGYTNHAQPMVNAEKFITAFARKTNFNGTILIQQKDQLIFRKSYGWADLAFKIPSTTDTRYKIASITKAFTAVLVMQLAEAGKIDLHKPIKEYLPGYRGEGKDKITIRHLLTMTAGMHNMDEGLTLEKALVNGIPQYQKPYTSQQLLELFCSDSLVNTPGEKFDYNNADFILLGKVIESVCGKSYEACLKENILIPLQLKNSGLLKQSQIIPLLANTYFYRDDIGQMVNDLPVYIENWYAAGAMYSTVDDLFSFAKALFNGKLLKPSSLQEMFVSGPGEYGYGVWVYKDYDINGKMYTIVKRPGSIMGAQAVLFQVLEANTTIIILSNSANFSTDELAADIAKQVL